MDDREIADHVQIGRLLNRYARAVDTRDWDLYRSVFTADAYIDYTSAPFGKAGCRDEIITWLGGSLAALSMTMHYIMNIDASIDVDTAVVHAQFFNPMQIAGLVDLSFCGGYYHHQLIRTPDGWLSQRLVEENIWFQKPPIPPSAG